MRSCDQFFVAKMIQLSDDINRLVNRLNAVINTRNEMRMNIHHYP